jgi:RHS repeat-associated protein
MDMIAGFGGISGSRTAYHNAAPAPNLLTSIQNEFHVHSDFTYHRLTEPLYYTEAATPSAFPVQNFMSPRYVVSKMGRSSGVGSDINYTDYTYGAGRVDVHGRGFLGFQIFDLYDETTQYTTQEMESQAFPWIGMTISSSTTHPSGSVASVSNTWVARSLFGGTTFPYLSSSIKTDVKTATKVTTTIPTSGVDDYGNITQRFVAYDGAGQDQEDNTFTNNTGTWQIGLLNSHMITYAGKSRKTAYSYFGSGLVNTEIDGITRLLTTTYARTTGGVVLSATKTGTGISSRVDTYGPYALCGQPFSDLNAAGLQTNFTYDPRFGEKLHETDPNGLLTAWTYDEFGREASETRPDTTSSATTYSTDTSYGAAYKATTIDTSRPDTVTYYDALDRMVAQLVKGANGAYRLATTVYRDDGMVTSSTDLGAFHSTTYSLYDYLQRPKTINHASGMVANLTYSGTTTGLTVTEVDTGGSTPHTTVSVKNSRSQTSSVTTDDGAFLIFQFDGNGYLTSANASGATTAAVYDDRGAKTSSVDPDLGSWSYGYDAAGNLTSQTDANTNTTSVTFDSIDRMTSRTVGGQTSTWTYDGTGTGNKLGKLSVEAGPNGYRKAYYYDAYARPSIEVSQIDGKYFYTCTGYDASGNVQSVDRYWRPLGLEGINFVGHDKWYTFGLRYDHDGDGHVTRVYDSAGRDWWKSPSYDNLDKLTAFTLGNGIVAAQTNDATTGSLLRLSSTVQNLTYTYDVFGNTKTKVDPLRSINSTYGYDELNRLTSADGVSMTYNNQGNLLSKGGLTLTYAGAPHPAHAVTSAGGVSYTYDATGNMTGRGSTSVTWTAFNMPNQIQSGTTISTFSYDGNFARKIDSTSTAGVVSKKYYLDDGFEQLSSAGRTETRVYVDAPSGAVGVRALLEQDVGVTIAPGNIQATHEELEYYHNDNLGSTYAVTDATGALIDQFTFDPWGYRTLYASGTGGTFALNTDHGYTGEEMLDAFGLVHMNGRIYDPLVGRMLSADPFVKDITNSQNHNRYSYVLNNPLTLTDPSGYEDADPNATKNQNSVDNWKRNFNVKAVVLVQSMVAEAHYKVDGRMVTEYSILHVLVDNANTNLHAHGSDSQIALSTFENLASLKEVIASIGRPLVGLYIVAHGDLNTSVYTGVKEQTPVGEVRTLLASGDAKSTGLLACLNGTCRDPEDSITLAKKAIDRDEGRQEIKKEETKNDKKN